MADNLPELRTTLLVDGLDGQRAGLVNPITGEVVPLSDPAKVADWMLACKAQRSALAEASQIAQEVLLAEMDRNASWTMNRPGGTVSSTSPSAGKDVADAWDGNTLWQVLTKLVQDGEITDQARASAIKVVTEYKAVAKGVKALLSLPAIAPYIETCRLPVEPKKRNVSVK